MPKSPPMCFILLQSKLFLKPFGYWYVIYVQKEETFLILYDLCRDIIGSALRLYSLECSHPL